MKNQESRGWWKENDLSAVMCSISVLLPASRLIFTPSRDGGDGGEGENDEDEILRAIYLNTTFSSRHGDCSRGAARFFIGKPIICGTAAL